MKFRRNANLNMPSGVDRGLIATEFKKCINYFDRIHDIFDKTGDGIDPYKSLRNELNRIKGWSETNSAHRQGPTSLDYRLRDAPEVKDIILNLLVDLNNALEEALDIASGRRQMHDTRELNTDCALHIAERPSHEVGETRAQCGFGSDQELIFGESVREINHVITCLHNVSSEQDKKDPIPEFSATEKSPKFAEDANSRTSHSSSGSDNMKTKEHRGRAATISKRLMRPIYAAQAFIRTGSSINSYDAAGLTAIHRAIKAGDPKLMAILLNAGANPGAVTRDGFGMQPIHIAARATPKDLDPNSTAPTIEDRTALLRLLLERKGVDVNARDNQQKTALIWACETGNPHAVELLLGMEDIDVNAKDNENRSAIMSAAVNQDPRALEVLLQRTDVDVNVRDEKQRTPLMSACEIGNSRAEELLPLINRTDVNAVDKTQMTALMWACKLGNPRIVELLLLRGDVDLNAKCSEHRTALMKACIAVRIGHGHDSVVKKLLQREDVDVNSTDMQKKNALMHACILGHSVVAGLLLEREDLDVNAKDGQGRTAYMLAYWSRQEVIVELMRKRPGIEIPPIKREG
ncbi:ankyrin repeat-containing domain protein, partial [Pyronema omphalodes]